MREILFRGKDVYRKEWVYGGYSLYPHTRFPCKPTIYEVGTGCWHPVEVIPETVGQYTGLEDKNSKKIFEGDIVKVDGKIYEVKYILGQFFIGINMPIAYKRFDCEVIGNIHDNPESLVGGTKE